MDCALPSEVRDCGKLIQNFKERGVQQMCCFIILLLFNEMQMSVQRFSAILHLRGFAVVPYLSEINRAKSFVPLSVPHVWDSGTHNKQ